MRINEEGLSTRRLPEVIGELQVIANERFSDILGAGESIKLDEKTYIGRVMSIIAEQQYLNEELIQEIWSKLDIDQADGQYLDKLVKLGRLERITSSPAFVLLMLRGVVGVTVDFDSAVSSKVSGYSFKLDTDVLFDKTKTNGVDITIPSVVVGNQYGFSYILNDGTNQYPDVTVTAIAGDTTRSVLQRINNFVINQTSQLSAVFVDQDTLKVFFKNQNYVGSFTEIGVSMPNCYIPTFASSTEVETPRQLAYSVDQIETAKLGWLGVTNPFESQPYETSESDLNLRMRYKNGSGISFNNRDSMIRAIYQINGVRYVNVRENIFDNETAGITPHGVSVVVLGGDEDAIAAAIKKNRPVGCKTYGDISKVVTDINGETYNISFSRPELVPIKISISLLTQDSFPQNGKILIQDAIIQYFDTLNVGDDVYLSRLYTPINTVNGQSVVDLSIAVVGDVLARDNIEILHNQLAVISYEDIDI